MASRLKLVALIAVFVGPLIVASLWYVNVDRLRPAYSTSAGELVQPPRPLSQVELQDSSGALFGASELRGRWHLLQLAPSGCDSICLQRLLDSRQIRFALGKDASRLQRILVVAAKPIVKLTEHPDLLILHADPLAFSTLQNHFKTTDSALHLMDPFANYMMWFAPEAEPSAMLKDIKKLLKVSRIG